MNKQVVRSGINDQEWERRHGRKPGGDYDPAYEAAAQRAYEARIDNHKWVHWDDQYEYVKDVWRRVAKAVLQGENDDREKVSADDLVPAETGSQRADDPVLKTGRKGTRRVSARGSGAS